MALRHRYAIAGIGETETGRLPEVSQMALAVRAGRRALEDAGMDRDEVDGVLTDQGGPTFIYSQEVAGSLGIRPRYTTVIEVGGATPAAMVQHAMMAIDAGLATNCLCIYAAKQRTGRRTVLRGYEEFHFPYGFMAAPAVHAMACRRHQIRYGSTSEDLGWIATSIRQWANRNPAARLHDAPLGMEQYLAEPWYVSPFRRPDICLVTDGGGAVLVTTLERARGLRKPPVVIEGIGQCHPHRFFEDAPDLADLEGAERSAADAFAMAGVRPQDMDFAEIYDCFTYTVLATLEAYGFCRHGEGGDFVRGGRIAPGGALPVTTHGGLLGQGHVDGMFHITEAVKQLRGGEVEPERQVPEPELCAVSGHGGNLSTHATLILSNRN